MSDETSRRNFLKGAAALTMAGRVRTGLGQATRTRPIRAYVGTYSSGEGGHGSGIYLFEMNPATGDLVQRDLTVTRESPSWIDLHPDRTHLFTVNEIGNFQGTDSGAVSVYAIDSSSGRLRLLNTVSSEGSGPAYLSVHPSGRYVMVANYGAGSIAVLPVRSGGELGPATDVKHDHGIPGKKHATDAPPGSFLVSGHEGPHAHMIHPDPKGRYVLHTDLGLDRIYVWTLDLEKGKLSPNRPPFVSLPSGDGPRHFAFHPARPWMYSLQEESSTLALFDYDAAKGTLSHRQTVSSLPPGFVGTSQASEVRISSDGRFVYAANRLHDSISWFAIGRDGRLSFRGEEWTRGDTPRSFNLDPSGTFVYSCNQLADAITVFRRDARSGRLSFTGRYVSVGTPAAIIFT